MQSILQRFRKTPINISVAIMGIYRYLYFLSNWFVASARGVFWKPFKLRMLFKTLNTPEYIQKSEDVLYHSAASRSGDVFQLAIPSQIDLIDQTVVLFQHRVTRFCQSNHLIPIDIRLCLQEAVANAIIHGNLGIPSMLKDDGWEQFEDLVKERESLQEFVQRQVLIRCQINVTDLTLEIEDEGQGFDTKEVQRELQKELLKLRDTESIDIPSSGRGLLIIMTFMDHVFWNDRGNCITMFKHFK